MSAHNLQAHQSLETMLAQLPDVGDALAAALANLSRDPTPDGAEVIACRLTGVARHVMLIRGGLLARSQSAGSECA